MLPAGTKYYVPITVNRTLIGAVFSNYPYQIDLSAKIASDAVFKSFITSSASISVYDPVTDSVRPRVVRLDLSNNKLLIYFDSSTSTSADKIFYVCVGNGAFVNSSDSFGNSGYVNHYGVDEFVNGSTIDDDVSGNTGVVGSASSIGVSGKFGNCFSGTYSINSKFTPQSEILSLNNATKYSFEFLLYRNSTSNDVLFLKYLDSTHYVNIYWAAANTFVMYVKNGAASGDIYFASTSVISVGAWHHLLFVYDGTQGVNTNRIKIYIDGVVVSPAFEGTIPTSFPNMSGYSSQVVGYNIDAKIDGVGLINNSLSLSYAVTRYNMFFNAGFWSVGTGKSLRANLLQVF